MLYKLYNLWISDNWFIIWIMSIKLTILLYYIKYMTIELTVRYTKYYLIKINKTINVKFVAKVVNFKFIPIWVIIFSYRISLFFHLVLVIVFYFGRHCLMISCTDVLCILCIILWWVGILLFVRLGTEWNWARISCVGIYYFWIFYLEV
jgi:hypothetical protein